MSISTVPTTYLNYLSRLLVIIDLFPMEINNLFALANFAQIEQESKKEFNSFWNLGQEQFLSRMEKKIAQLETSTSQDKYIIAYVFCIKMDEKITYVNDNNPNNMSISSLISIKPNRPTIQRGPLNPNYKDTLIEIHPKFGVYDIIEKGEETKSRELSNKDAFTGINGLLKKISYTTHSPKFQVTDIILDFPDSFTGESLTIGFSPMTNQDIIKLENKQTMVNGLSFDVSGSSIKEKKESFLENRLEDLWIKASELNTDIVFFPEMLGVKTWEVIENSYHSSVKRAFEKVIELGFSPPKLTFLPSFCENNSNSISIVYQDGQALGKQNKQRPFIDRTNHKMEAVTPAETQTIIVIHIPGVHRIAIMICSDYLTCSLDMQKKLFADLGITLLLVPSYSRGEQDFINKLPELKKYGTSVVWGNCCAATKPKRIIGGCSIAALDDLHRFKDYARCDNNCKKSCLFLVKIPMHIKRDLREKVKLDNIIFQELL